jgi:uncharacterized membrane protein
MDPSGPVSVTTDPLWPWSSPTFGWYLLLSVAAVVMALSTWSYYRSGAPRQHVASVLLLRLIALVLIFLCLAGTSLVARDQMRVPSWLLVGLDASESMTVQDEVDGQARWNYLMRLLRDPQMSSTLQKLRDDHNINVLFFRFGAETQPFDLADPGKADGPRTDTAQMLQDLYDKYRSERYLRALLVLSDGADNASSEPSPLSLAGQWRSLPCPLHTFGFGKTTTPDHQNDIAITAINPEPSVVAIKGELMVRATIDAPGFENSQVRVKVFFDDKEVITQDEVLKLTTGNEVRLKCTAPTEPGEIKVTVKVHRPDKPEPLPGEVSAANNEMSTYVTVTKEGVSVLLIERQERFPEPQMLCDALAEDRRIRVHTLWLRGKDTISEDQKDLFQFSRQHYDVIILGDVTADRLKSLDPRVLATIHELVDTKRTGLLMFGGRYAFGNGDWKGTEIEKLLPVQLDATGQSDAATKVVATPAGLKFILRQSDTPDDSKMVWARLRDLNGFTRLGKPKGNAQLLAETNRGDPLLVAQDYGSGRTMAFGGSTTHLWVINKDGFRAHSRFWRQAILWLAHQEETDDFVRIKPDVRRLRSGDKLGFSVEMRGKSGEDLKETTFNVKIVDPKGNATPIPIVKESEERGQFKPRLPGEYRIEAAGTGKDAKNDRISGNATARFIVYQDDAETARRSADHKFLRDLAGAGGGRFHKAEDLLKYLQELPSQPLPQGAPKPAKWPDWRLNKGRSPFLVGFLILFVQVLALEWFLRRRWGMI